MILLKLAFRYNGSNSLYFVLTIHFFSGAVSFAAAFYNCKLRGRSQAACNTHIRRKFSGPLIAMHGKEVSHDNYDCVGEDDQVIIFLGGEDREGGEGARKI